MKLVIGNKNYSSWSLRPWLAMRAAAIPFEEVRIPLYEPESKARQLVYSPAGKVPVLVHGGLRIWDSLAICEYLAEKFPDRRLWPEDAAARARARSITAEMHSGFAALRMNLPMNCRASYPGVGRQPEVLEDIARIIAIWTESRTRHAPDGAFLFGRFSIADAFYAPVVTRFKTYGVKVPALCSAYMDTILALPPMIEWYAAARAERERIAGSELDPAF